MNPTRTRELALAIASFPSVTGSEGETRFAGFLRDLLADWPYFRSHPEHLRLIKTLDDGRERYVLAAAAVARGAGVRPARAPIPTVILTGHYDVVSTANYGPLEPYAFDPEALSPRLAAALEDEARAASLRGESLGETESRALRDLSSGDFLPGRGLLDMKAGLAAGLALLEDFAAQAEAEAASRGASAGAGPGAGPDRTGGLADDAPGALLFLAVPDEEGSSHGMLSAVRALPGLLSEWGLAARAAINLDAAVDQGEGEAGRAVFLGSVGKLHPFVLFLGRPSHAGAPFDGVNPALLAAEYARRIECADLFGAGSASSDDPGGAAAGTPATEARSSEPPSPPTILYYRELRDRYDVTTPESVFVSANLLTHDRGPASCLEAVSRLAGEAMEAALGLLRGRAAAFAEASGWKSALPDRTPRVLGWAELEELARAAGAAAWEAARARAAKAADAGDAMGALMGLVSEAVRAAGLEGPAAVVGLAPPYYPRSRLDSVRDGRLLGFVEKALEAAEARGLGRTTSRPFFPGISDMSFLYPEDDASERLLASAACPLGLDPLPAGFSCPALNLGPWGREYHQRLERVHASYAFGILPELLRLVTERILAGK